MEPDARAITQMFEAVSLGAPHRAVGFVMWRVVHRYQREVDQALRALNLTHLQFVILALTGWAACAGGPVTQSALAALGDIHPMQVSHVLRILERKGLIGRTPSPRNSLAKHVAITARGVGVLRDALPIVIDVQARLFGEAGRPGGALLEALVRIDQV